MSESPSKRRVVLGFIGTVLDAGRADRRFDKWRPTVAMCAHPSLPVDRYELLRDARHSDLADTLAADMRAISPTTEVRQVEMNLTDPWDFEEVFAALHDYCRAYPFDPEAEDYLVNITTGTHVAQICWFLLAEAHYVPGRIVQLTPPKRWKDGAPGGYTITDLDLSRYDRIARRFRAETVEATSFLKSGIATRNPAFNRMIDRIEQVALRSRAPLLLTGPTGAGKSQLARRIYDLKKTRRQVAGPFVEVNCATLRGDSAMSTLFGHVKGAFTGALAERAGLLKSADGGILFLDEIGELGPDEQAMCLRAIEDKRFLPVGADRETASDFQLIAGTNRDLGPAVAAGRFREDLLARLNLWTFDLPGLKDRREDIEPNVEFELKRHAEREGVNVTFNRQARARYMAFALSADALWSANFRDLGASITRMATLAPGGRIDEAVVEEEIGRLMATWHGQRRDGPEARLAGLIEADRLARIDPFDRFQLAEVIRICRESPSLSAAGRTLFAASRLDKASSNDADRLRKYLTRFGLDWATVTERGG
ncbi:transcriptional regulator [Prosthecomicrobium hirschii]|uniref:Transcriptional regulator n=1 Tax=Prosthecodimorpha hirschii TaxID=665126 RepID=A0A0P6W115_9HYPH|nr:RNA repair transcriptional activator RtcR [Prosthecomicrobium hirschii]KPL52782.1 transcriptional regulator [Prosthecomicrobium hirschii]